MYIDMYPDMEMTVVAHAPRWALAHAGHALAASLSGAFDGFSQAAAPLALTALWQGAALACGLALCLRLATRASAAHRFLLWAAGFAALVSLPFLPLLMDSAGGASSATTGLAASAAAKPWLQLDLRWSLAIGALWIVASLLRAVDLGMHSLRLRRLWKNAVPVEIGERVSHVSEARHGALGHRRVEICTTTELDRPSVIGFFAPRILIPDWLYARLTHEELEQVVLHEAEHLRRRDDWTNLLQKLCLVLFPLNPALIWMERRLCREREMACDDGVVRATQAPRAYAACLTSLAERGLQRRAEALSLGAWQRRPELVDRVHRILRRNPGLSPLATRALLGAMACGLVLGSLEFARCPQLIAFVPQRSAQAAQAPGAAVAMNSATRGLQEFRAVETLAAMPSRRSAKPAGSRMATARAASIKTPAAQESAALAEPASSDTRQVLLKAEMSEPEPDAKQMEQVQMQQAKMQQTGPQQAQQWIVFTTWEQVETPAQTAAVPAHAKSGTNTAQATGAANNQPSAKATSRITVTRLILRVVPASSLSGMPAAIPTRDGWLFIEL